MTVALVLAAEADAGTIGQLTALGVRRVDAAEQGGQGLLTVAAAARAAGERVLIYSGEGAVPERILARLLAEHGTAAFTGVSAPGRAPASGGDAPPAPGALVVDTPDLGVLAACAESLAATPEAPVAVGSLLGELRRCGVTVAMVAAGPDGDGPVAVLAGPASRDIARWASWRMLTPAAMYGISLGLGLLAAVWFSESATRAELAAAAALLASFLASRAGSLLAASGREDSAGALAAWVGAAAGLLTEIAVYAALAVSAGLGASRAATASAGLTGIFGRVLQHTAAATWAGAGPGGVWRLAVAAVAMLGIRHLAGLTRECRPRRPGSRARLVAERAVVFQAGERFAVIAVTVVFFGPRLTFLALLGLGAVAAAFAVAGYAAAPAAPEQPAGGGPAGYRGDGDLAHWLGGFARGMLPPLLPVLVGLFVIGVLTALGLQNLPGVLALTPAAAMLPAALGACHPHDEGMDWLVPPLLMTGECVYLAALGFSHHVRQELVFALIAAVVLRHADLGYRARCGRGLAADRLGLGWDGRMLVAGLAAMVGLTPPAYAVVSGYLWLLFCWDYLTAWLGSAQEASVDRDGPGRRRGSAAAA
ncbi:MAG: hypothetical protein JO132_07415 [Streptosporangiaceae bacterium]|nr:hypothetical protein [Streptosporangiaceae bacterium]